MRLHTTYGSPTFKYWQCTRINCFQVSPCYSDLTRCSIERSPMRVCYLQTSRIAAWSDGVSCDFFLPNFSLLAHQPHPLHCIVGSYRLKNIFIYEVIPSFNTVAAKQLLPKLQSLGVSGRDLAWFKSYLTGGNQQVSWDGTLSDLIMVR
jgi:hypothetical protein